MRINSVTSFGSSRKQSNIAEKKREAYEKALDEELLKSLDMFNTGEADALYIRSLVKEGKNGEYEAELDSTPVQLKKKGVFKKLTDRFKLNKK